MLIAALHDDAEVRVAPFDVVCFALGALWGAMWLRRRSIVAAAVCHALFNLGQVLAAWAVGRQI